MIGDHSIPDAYQFATTIDTAPVLVPATAIAPAPAPAELTGTATRKPDSFTAAATATAVDSVPTLSPIAPLISQRESSPPAPPGATKNAMAASPFLPQPHSFRTAVTSAQSTFPSHTVTLSSAVSTSDRDQALAMGAPFGTPSPMAVSVLIRRLPLNTSEESLRLMLVFSKELVDVEVLRAERIEDPGFVCAILKFKTLAGAQETQSMLHGKPNISNDAEMIVEILNGGSPGNGRRHMTDAPIGPPAPAHAPASAASSATSSATSSRQPSRFNGAFGAIDTISPPMNAVYGNELSSSEPTTHFQSIFSPQSPIGNHLAEPRVTGKSLINDAADDDETGELLKDPVAYAENGSMGGQARRLTAPQIPISRMAGLSLNTNGHAIASYGPASMGPMSAHSNTMSPTLMNGAGHGMNYMTAGHAFASPRHNFPPVNPADQNPPCNTLYVGNLPIDTSEEELKATFAKQRGYKRLCFRTKQNGPMCFVEFEDVSFATKALHDLYGHMLHNSVKGGIRLSFSKNPLGVRSGPSASPVPGVGGGGANSLASINSMMVGSGSGGTVFSTLVNGPPPGLTAPPGLGGMNRVAAYNNATTASHSVVSGGGGAGAGSRSGSAFSAHNSNPWNAPVYGNTMATGGPSPLATGVTNGYPAYMLGR